RTDAVAERMPAHVGEHHALEMGGRFQSAVHRSASVTFVQVSATGFEARPRRDLGRLPLPKGEGWGEGLQTLFGPTPSPQPSPQPKWDVSDFGHAIEGPNSGKPEFGWGEGVPPCRGWIPCSPKFSASKDAEHRVIHKTRTFTPPGDETHRCRRCR